MWFGLGSDLITMVRRNSVNQETTIDRAQGHHRNVNSDVSIFSLNYHENNVVIVNTTEGYDFTTPHTY